MSESMAAPEAPATSSWWGEFRIPHGAVGRWLIGPMTMWIERQRGEWIVSTVTGEDPEHGTVEVHVPLDASDRVERPEAEQTLRFGVSRDDEHIVITPRLADRLVVTTPVSPFYIPAGEVVTVFVGSPLWLRLEHQRKQLCEFPILRPSDTWFGVNTLSGELGYASRTACRLRFEEFQVQPHRAVTAVTVHNRSRTPLLLDRMKLPVEYLHLFVSETGVFWTSDLQIIHKGPDELADVEPGPRTPRRVENPYPISEPRIPGGDNLVMRVFTSIFR